MKSRWRDGVEKAGLNMLMKKMKKRCGDKAVNPRRDYGETLGGGGTHKVKHKAHQHIQHCSDHDKSKTGKSKDISLNK